MISGFWKFQKIIICVFLLLATPVMAQVYYRESKDDLTGRDNSYVSFKPSSKNEELNLSWQCLGYVLDITLWHHWLGGDKYNHVNVLYRFDDDKPSLNNSFYLSKSRKSTFFDRGSISPFTKKAMVSDQVIVRIIDPIDDGQLTATFKLKGLAEKLKKLPCTASYF